MWLLTWIPDWVFHIITLLGVLGVIASSFFSFIPFIKQYVTAIRVTSIVVLVFGVFMEGAISNQSVWESKIKDLQVKVAEAQADSAKENLKIVEKIVYKDKIIKENNDNVTKYIDREVVKYDSQCKIPNEFIKALNDATGVKK